MYGNELGVERGEGVGARVLGRVEGAAAGVRVGARGLVDVRVRALLVRDDVGRVVGDDVEVDVDAAEVGVVDERLQLGVGAEVGIDLREVGHPVAVVAGTGIRPRALDRPVLEARGEPDRGGAEALDVVETIVEAGDVAAVVEALVGGVEAMSEAIAGDAGRVVRRVAVGEAVGHDEVELLLAARLPDRVCDERIVVGGVSAADRHDLDADAVSGVVEQEAERRGAGHGEREVPPSVGTIGLGPTRR